MIKKKEFIAWLKTKKTVCKNKNLTHDSHVWSTCCPLATYAKEEIKSKNVRILGDYYILNDKIYATPKWMSDFIFTVDDEIATANITAKQCLNILKS